VTNFIRHLRDWVERFEDDDRLGSAHIALYFALFYEWNARRFVSPFPVLRSEMMGLAKIRSPNAYARCMRELDQWGYIRYQASYNPRQASSVHLFRFNKRDTDVPGDLYENTALHTGVDKGGDTPGDTAGIPVRIPFNKTVLKKINNKNLINTHESGDQNSIFSDGGRTPDRQEADHTDRDHEQQKEKNSDQGGRPGDVEEVKAYFADKKASLTEAEHFYNYYQSIGWKIGKLHKPVENWRYAADNWILNNNKHQHDDQPNTLRRGTSLVRIDKNYDQPL